MRAANSLNLDPNPNTYKDSTSITDNNDDDFPTSTCTNLNEEEIGQLKVDDPPEENRNIIVDDNDDGDNDGDNYNRDSSSQPSLSYIGKKPKWWKTLARRKGTKGQRNAISLMTQRGYIIPKLDKYQHVLNVQELISVEKLPRGTPLTNELLIPISSTTSTTSLSPSMEETIDIDDNENKIQNVAAKDRFDTEQDEGNEREILKSIEEKVVHLEIGFGQGENLLTNAMMHPDQFYIGAEIHQPGVGIALRRMSQALEDGQYWAEQTWWSPTSTATQTPSSSSSAVEVEAEAEAASTNTTPTDSLNVDDRVRRQNELLTQGRGITSLSAQNELVPILPYDNLRIYPGDGVKILRFLPPSSIDNIYLTFPDPWPKNHQSPWRVIQEDTLELIRSALKPGGCFYLATDSTIFDEWSRKVFDIVNAKTTSRGSVQHWEEMDVCPSREGWLPVFSKYESKGIEEGRYTICRCWKYHGR